MLRTLLSIIIFTLIIPISFTQDLNPIKKGSKYVYVNVKGEREFKSKFERARYFFNGLAAVKLEGKWGFINTQGEFVIPNVYNSVEDFRNVVSFVKNDDNFYFVDKDGLLGEHQYDSIFLLKNYFILKKDELYGIADSTSRIIEEPKFQDLGTIHRNILTVKIKNQWVNWSEGKLIFENPKLYFSKPERMPIYSKECIGIEDHQVRNDCSTKAMLEDMFHTVKYPIEAKKNGVGGTIVVQFVINENGEVEDSRIIRDIGAGCGEEGLRVVNNVINKWSEPGIHDNLRINTVYNLPVKFKLK